MTEVRIIEFETEFYLIDSENGVLSMWADLESALTELESLTGSRDGSIRRVG